MNQNENNVQPHPIMFHPETNPSHTAVCAVLTDGESVYDTRIIHPDELPYLNESAQSATEGELQWQMITTRRYGELPNIRQLFELTTEAMTPLQTLYCHLYASRVGLKLNEDEFETIQRQLARVTAVLKHIQNVFHAHGRAPVPLYYYQLGSGVACNPELQTAEFECFSHAFAFQEQYPNWRVGFTQPTTFDLSDELDGE